MNSNQRLEKYDYYNSHLNTCPVSGPDTPEVWVPAIEPCPPCPGIEAYPAPPWDKSVAEHNLDHSSHPYILSLLRNSKGNYYSVDTLVARDALDEELRSIGVMVYVTETDALYRLEEGIENENWVETNVNSQNISKLGRFNPPSNPVDGMVYFNLLSERLEYYNNNSWNIIPNQKDIANAVHAHDTDPNAHASRFAEVENKWLAI